MTKFQIAVLALLAIGVLGVFVIGGVMIAVTLQAPNASTSPADTPRANPAQMVSSANWEYRITRTEQTKEIGTIIGSATAQGTFLIVYLSLKNTGKQNAEIHPVSFSLRDSNNVTYDTIDERIINAFLYAHQLTPFSSLTGIPPYTAFVPGVSVDTAIIFDINPDAKQIQLQLGQTATLVVSDVETVPTVIPPTAWPGAPTIRVAVVTPTAQTISRPTATTCTASLQRLSIPNGKPLHVDETLSNCSKSFAISMANGQVIQFAYFGYNDSHWTDFKVRDPTGKIIQGEGAAGSLYFAATLKGDYTLTFQGPGRLIFDVIVENMPSN